MNRENEMMKKAVCILCALILTVGVGAAHATAAEASLFAKGWFETICAELAGVSDSDVTAVSYSGTMSGTLMGDDFNYLVRDVDGGVRIDIPGLKAGTYSLNVTAGGKTYTAADIQVMAYDRSGYAHWKHTEGVGAYNDDGTLKDNARVLYVTEKNKNTLTLSAHDGGRTITVTGIGNILNRSNGSVGNNGILQHLALNDRAPLVVRIVGRVTAPEGLIPWVDSTDFPRDNGSNGSMAMLRDTANVTIEGIGGDACIDGWGLSFSLSKAGLPAELGRNFEVRNLTFRNVPEDGVEIAGYWAGSGMEDVVEHTWVHNCAFYVPHIENPAADDKAEGDGAMDFKRGRYMTLSYNYFEGYHKTSIIGADDNEQYHVTWHHNHWKGCDQRCPLVREANVHIYNNLYEKNQTNGSSHCMGLRVGSYVFSEYNQFVDCTNAVRVDLDEAIDGSRTRPGVCKSWQDVFENCKRVNNAVAVATKDEAVPNSNKYPDFETNPELSYIPSGDYALDESIEEARANIDAYTGPMKALADIAVPSHRHQWSGWNVETAATCVQDGRWTRTCSAANCPESSQSRSVPAVGHRYEGYRCIRCGDDLRGKTYVLTADQAAQVQIDSPTPNMVLGGDPEKPDSYCAIREFNDMGGTEGFFTIIYGEGDRLDPGTKTFPDGYRAGWRFNPIHSVNRKANAIRLDLLTPATVKVWWVGAAAGRSIVLLDEKGKEAYATAPAATSDYAPIISRFDVTAPGAYYLGGKGGRSYIYKVEVTMAASPETLQSGVLSGPEGRTLAWEYTEDAQLTITGALEAEERALAGCYDDRGRLSGVKLLTARTRTVQLEGEPSTIRLFWVDASARPLSQAATAWNGK